MIDKANVTYDRWSAGLELPNVVLRRYTSDDECDSTNGGGGGGGMSTGDVHVDQYGTGQYQEPEPFARFHPRLLQCVIEVHERVRSLVTSRHACQCSPPSIACPLHTWGPTPVNHSPSSPVLPPEVPQFACVPPGPSYSQNGLGNGNGYNEMSSSSSSSSSSQSYPTSSYGMQPDQGIFYSNSSLSNSAAAARPAAIQPSWPPSTLMTLSPTSKMAIVDTMNFELGALNSNGDQSWMAFF